MAESIGSIRISRVELLLCISRGTESSRELLDKISQNTDSFFQINICKIADVLVPTVSSQIIQDKTMTIDDNWTCSICKYSSHSENNTCEMCETPRDVSIEITNTLMHRYPPGFEPKSSLITAPVPALISAPSPVPALSTSNQYGAKSDLIRQFMFNNTSQSEIDRNAKGGFKSSKATSRAAEIAYAFGEDVVAASGGAASGGAASGGAASGESDTSSVTSSNIASDSAIINAPISCKLYVKWLTESNSPFMNNNIRNFIIHFNNALCRAFENGLIHYISGLQPLSKSTSALIVFKSDLIATSALNLHNCILWNGEHLQLQRPQGYQSKASPFAPLKMNIVRELEGVILPPIINPHYQKANALKKHYDQIKAAKDRITASAIASLNTSEPIAPKKKKAVSNKTIRDEDLQLVQSLQSNLRKGPLDYLNILCSQDGREQSIYYDTLLELCLELHRHSVFVCDVNDKRMIIYENEKHTKTYCITNRDGKTPIKLYSITEIRTILRNAKFPEYAFRS